MGSTNATHGVPGLENCFRLKTISDAQGIRRRIMDNLERATFPSITEQERKRLLSFVICGGGPTGVEMAAELFGEFVPLSLSICFLTLLFDRYDQRRCPQLRELMI
jgi:NADH dehydrogenase FAD-containing subunit